MKASNSPVGGLRYKNLAFRLIAPLVASHFIIVYGEPSGFFELIIDPDYYLALLPNYGFSLILVALIHWVNKRLDRSYDWLSKPLQRTMLQLTFGLLLPAVLAFIFAFFYFRVNGMYVLNTPYLRFDFPIIVLLLLLLNSYYIGYYLYCSLQGKRDNTVQAHEADAANRIVSQTFVVNAGAKTIPIPITDISYFYREGEYNYVRTFNSERFLIAKSLDEVQQQLSEQEFFRANRQFLVNRKACEHFELLEYGKLELSVNPPGKEKIIVSQKRAKSFKDWMVNG